MIYSPWFLIYELGTDRAKFKNKLGAYMAEAWEGQSIQATESTYKERIFEKGLNTAQQPIGEYGRYYSIYHGDFWIPVRKKAGKQVKFVDLDYKGKLKRSIHVEASVRTAYLVSNSNIDSEGDNPKTNFQKAKFQEWLQGDKKGEPPMEIFTPSEEELQKLENRLILELEKNIFFLK